MAIRGMAVQAFRYEFKRIARPLQEERKSITTDRNYTATERARALAPLDAKLAALESEYRTNIAKQVEIARVEHIKARPSMQQLKAAFVSPARAVAVRQLAEGQSAHMKHELAQLVVAEKDAAAAFGLRQALTPDDMTAVGGILSTVGFEQAEIAMADYQAARVEAARFEDDGAFGDAAQRDPVAALARAYALQTIPDGNGGTITLTDADVRRLCEKAGVSEGAP